REFIMKDAYSFDRDNAGLDKSYKKMYEAYEAIFKRCGLNAIPVEADSGVMGGDVSHEFMVLAENGEDLLAHCVSCGYAASLAVAEISAQAHKRTSAQEKEKPLQEVDTPGVSTIEKVGTFLKVRPGDMIKTLIYIADGESVAILIRGDHEANETKIKRHLKCATLEMASEHVIKKTTGGPLGFSGPVGLKGIRIAADNDIKDMANFVTGANKKDRHFINVNISRDFDVKEWADLRMITENDNCPKCNKDIKIEHAIEMGHVFKLGLKYSKAMKAEFLDEDGKLKPCVMGCYGIGVNRIIAAAIELNNDEKGIIWPLSIAPFQVMIVPINYSKEDVKKISDKVYNALSDKGIEVLLDDRDESAGVKFNDAELIGIPAVIVIGDRGLKKGILEIKNRRTGKISEAKIEDIERYIPAILNAGHS
ncbi:MAG: proline--tRNA ligase, partial [Candidatus Omnitrophica bacterium]|nr:proline--tRNA ligase [Candidatus Omnitrophota bacterium]